MSQCPNADIPATNVVEQVGPVGRFFKFSFLDHTFDSKEHTIISYERKRYCDYSHSVETFFGVKFLIQI